MPVSLQMFPDASSQTPVRFSPEVAPAADWAWVLKLLMEASISRCCWLLLSGAGDSTVTPAALVLAVLPPEPPPQAVRIKGAKATSSFAFFIRLPDWSCCYGPPDHHRVSCPAGDV